MLSGRRLDLLDPSPLDIEIEDIAHGLAFVARWNGQTTGEHPYSVAEHALLVEDIFARRNRGIAARWRLAALLHDAAEYVLGDMISPVKAAIGPQYRELDQRLTAAVHLRFGLPAELPRAIRAEIKHADRISARAEASAIAGYSRSEADRLFGKADINEIDVKIRPPGACRAAFLERFRALAGEVSA
jgi:5'-deoxynucleotidase YfbR-like HD superfamily hydrolase